MIPVRLSLQNFMCYRSTEPPLDFSGIHLACLSGDNGNGKSALIDAMTWALWGKTRAGSDDDLIFTNQAEMAVEFDFQVGEQLYRIIRRRARPKKRGGAGQSALELQVDDNGGFRSITGDTIARTQQHITEEVLHMDYDTFVNSAYLRQGHADEFTNQQPAKRKEVLGNILGLADYDALEERAKELSRRQETETAQLENAIGEMGAELAQQPACEAELAAAQQSLAEIEAAAQQQETALNGLRQQKEALDGRKAQLDELAAGLAADTRNLASWEEQTRQHRARLDGYEAVIGRRAGIEAGYAQFTQAKKLNDELEQKFRQSVSLERQRSQLEARVREAGHSLNTEHAVIQGEINNTESKVSNLPGLKEKLAQSQARLAQLAGAETDIAARERDASALQAAVGRREADNARLEKEIGELNEKLDLLKTHLAEESGGTCPLCESELTREGLQHIEAKYSQEKADKEAERQTGIADLAQQKAALAARQKETAQAATGLQQEKAGLQGQVSVIGRDIAEAEAAARQLAVLKEKRAAVEQRLAQRDFAAAEQEALADVEGQLAALDYDAAAHEAAQRQLAELQNSEQDWRRLEEADQMIETERQALVRAEASAKELQERLAGDRKRQESLTAELAQQPQVLDALAKAEAAYREISTRRSQAQQAVGSAGARLERLGELAKRKKEKEGMLSAVARESSIYKELARAFGKTGVQALLIEMALPEIENEANRLLGRMTDGRMTLTLEPQRATKSGTIREVLDIFIADELGTRNYEMFSGGEAFRINFAIRIALSRLLARRAGAPLPTLIIDEGFGTQDSTGMEKLKEAINSIQDDFEKVLVITHMDELKDAFPVRIDVVKTAEGSQVTVG